MNVGIARALLAEGFTHREVAGALGCTRRDLRRALASAPIRRAEPAVVVELNRPTPEAVRAALDCLLGSRS